MSPEGSEDGESNDEGDRMSWFGTSQHSTVADSTVTSPAATGGR